MRASASSILIVLSMLIGEVHTFWERSPLQPQNWIYAIDRTMSIQWNIKFVSSEVSFVLLAMAFLFYTPTRVNRATAVALVWFAVFNIGAYFYNYKTFGFGWLYVGFVVVWLVAFFRHRNSNLIR